MLNVNLQHGYCKQGYPLNLIPLESIICKGSNCGSVKLPGLEREQVLGGEKALMFFCLEISEKQSCAKPSLHLQELWVKRRASRGISRCVLFPNNCEKNWTCYLEMPCHNSQNGFH